MSGGTFVNFNGTILNASQAFLPTSNRAFRYGDGLFESIRMVKGELPLLEMHAARIRQGMKVLKLEGYQQFDAARMEEEISRLARSNKIFANARIRFMIFREGGGLYTPGERGFAFLAEMQRLEESLFEINKKGLLIDIFPDVPKTFSILSGLKSMNALPYVLSGMFNQEHKLDESILLNERGELCESTASNIFLVKNKELHTPALESGCVDGVMRRLVLQLAREAGLQVFESRLHPDSLGLADEIFLTNAVKGIQWVVGYRSKRYFNRVAKSLSDALNAYITRIWADSKL